MIHAQLDSNNICTGYGELLQVETAPSLVYLPDGWDEDFLWRKYENGQWSTEKFLPPVPEPQPDAQTQIEALRAKDAEIILTLVMNDLM